MGINIRERERKKRKGEEKVGDKEEKNSSMKFGVGGNDKLLPSFLCEIFLEPKEEGREREGRHFPTVDYQMKVTYYSGGCCRVLIRTSLKTAQLNTGRTTAPGGYMRHLTFFTVFTFFLHKCQCIHLLKF